MSKEVPLTIEWGRRIGTAQVEEDPDGGFTITAQIDADIDPEVYNRLFGQVYPRQLSIGQPPEKIMEDLVEGTDAATLVDQLTGHDYATRPMFELSSHPDYSVRAQMNVMKVMKMTTEDLKKIHIEGEG